MRGPHNNMHADSESMMATYAELQRQQARDERWYAGYGVLAASLTAYAVHAGEAMYAGLAVMAGVLCVSKFADMVARNWFLHWVDWRRAEKVIPWSAERP